MPEETKSNQEQKPNVPKPPMDEESIRDRWMREQIVDLADMPPKRQWNTGKHLALLVRWAEECGLPESTKLEFKKGLAYHTLGGNMSAFTKWAAGEKVNLIDKPLQSLSDYD